MTYFSKWYYIDSPQSRRGHGDVGIFSLPVLASRLGGGDAPKAG